MSKKNHDRSPDKKGFSVALPIVLIEVLEAIAREEHRSRNGQIEYFLDKAAKQWKQEQLDQNGAKEQRTTPNIVNPGDAYPEPEKVDRFHWEDTGTGYDPVKPTQQKKDDQGDTTKKAL